MNRISESRNIHRLSSLGFALYWPPRPFILDLVRRDHDETGNIKLGVAGVMNSLAPYIRLRSKVLNEVRRERNESQ
jgi:hypothetical protein